MPAVQRYRRIVPLLFVAIFTVLGNAAADEIEFRKHVQPILKTHCFDCHGPDTQESGLRLDRRANLLRGGDSGEPAVVSENSAASHLIDLVMAKNRDDVMPPEGDRLSPAEIKILAAWIDGGLKMPPEMSADDRITTDHWSFQPVRRPAIPEATPEYPVNPIDNFVLTLLTANRLQPSDPAESHVLIRRLFLVMHGLPPTPLQMAKWSKRLAENRTVAWHDLVEEVLASERYGERWARHWLDIIRFGETHGFETNRERPNAWHFRDYVISAFNNDLPYDQFVTEQIAGDAVGAEVATGYLVAGPHDLVKSPDKNLTLMQRQDELSDLINVTGTTFMGLTLGCARCHNHKFDPITQRDFYSIQAVFAGVNHGDRTLPVSSDRREKLQLVNDQLKKLQQQLTEFIPPAAGEIILLDDDQQVQSGQRGVRHLLPRNGQGVNPGGQGRGQKDDPGGPKHSPNLSGGKYSWWTNKADTDVAVYQPVTRGRYRVWISWGNGHETHSEDARFVMDADGMRETMDDQTQLASVNQKLFSDKSGDVVNKSLWSGFFDCGVQELLPSTVIFLRGGRTGTAITGDVMLLEAVDSATDTGIASKRAFPSLRPAVNAVLNREILNPVQAKFVRFTVRQTNSSEPCIDELEVWSDDRNVALASNGTKATSSGNLPGYEIHKLEHINDGRIGNDRSWISNERGKGWVQLEFTQPRSIDRIEWARDRNGRFADRVATDYIIEASINGTSWQQIASSADRIPFTRNQKTQPSYDFTLHGEERGKVGRAWLAESVTLQKEKERLEKTPAVYAGIFSQPPPTYRLYRGDPLAPREEVRPDVLEVVGTLGLEKTSPERERRIQFSKWLTSPNHPLAARVIVNRLWQHHFGTGIVATPNDFGKNGVPPSHPQLLDWLASDLMQNNWSLKHIHRLILHSATWQQSSVPRRDAVAVDAASRFLWRFPPRRLEAEAIRDSILSVSGVLNLRMGGPGFSGFEVQMENVRHFFPKKTYGPEDFRRMIYMTKVRQEQESVFGAFDCPDASQVISERSRSTTPLQALNLMNSSFTIEQANLLAKRLADSSSLASQQIQNAFERCFSRSPDDEEISASMAFIKAEGLAAFCRAILNSNEFLFVP